MLRRLPLLVALPANITHEMLHALAAAPWADDVHLVIQPQTGACKAIIDWGEPAAHKRPLMAFSALAPLIAGVLALCAAFWNGYLGVLPPGSTSEFLALAALGGYAALTFGVSRQDLREAWGETDG
jgi:hypothetical protein